MRRVAIAGSRHRGWKDKLPADLQEANEVDAALIRGILLSCKTHFPEFYVLTIGADLGFGRSVRRIAAEEGVGVAEIIVRMNDRVPRMDFELIYLSRHAALVDLADEFYLFVTDARVSQLEDLIQRLEEDDRPVTIYGEDGSVILRRNHDKERTGNLAPEIPEKA